MCFDTQMKKTKQQGVVLVFTLLLLVIISLLVFAGLNRALLQTKVTQAYFDQAVAEQAARSAVAVLRAKLISGEALTFAHPGVVVTSQSRWLAATAGGAQVYQLESQASYRSATAQVTGYVQVVS